MIISWKCDVSNNHQSGVVEFQTGWYVILDLGEAKPVTKYRVLQGVYNTSNRRVAHWTLRGSNLDPTDPSASGFSDGTYGTLIHQYSDVPVNNRTTGYMAYHQIQM